MPFQSRELYRSGPNGDRWSLVRDAESGRVFIEHEPNVSSGGQTSHMEIGDFLAHGGHGPEHQALLHLIGTLVEKAAAPRAPSGDLPKARSKSAPNTH
jgi:hypothetical protein